MSTLGGPPSLKNLRLAQVEKNFRSLSLEYAKVIL